MSHTHLPDPRNARYLEIRKVTLIGSVVDLLLGVVKILVGTLASSQALIADGMHSLSDLATDFLVLFAAKHAHREADTEHPYGHGRIETVATVVLGVALVIVAVGISVDAVLRLLEPDSLLHPGPLALVVALLSVASKEAIYQYTAKAARRLRSNMLHANAWHSRSDAISSIIVVFGVGGAMAGFPWLDAAGAIAVALMIAKIGWDLLWKSLMELIDTALEPEQVEKIRQMILDVNGVRACHMLRTRYSGSDSLVDVHILVDPALSVSEGHQIGERVRERLLNEVEHVADVTVHIDPEDDELASPCHHLPLRDEVLRRLYLEWQPLGLEPLIHKVVLHYLDGKVHVDVFVEGGARSADELAELSASIRAAAGRLEDIGEVAVYFSA
ncbi:MAG: cation diffusion facilitator family transporter [Gammaproteobacteria bacterium]|nr:cation diffusion facilitator family transporter [Gammaproteobacteria bacterium]